MSGLLYQRTDCARSFLRQTSLPSILQVSLALPKPRCTLAGTRLSRGSAKSKSLLLSDAAWVGSGLKTTSG